GCTGVVALRVLGAKRTFHATRTKLAGDCRIKIDVAVPRGSPARLLATVAFSGNGRLLPRLVGPRPMPREVPLAVPHPG
ncbi:MAG: hypothetical protein H0T69_11955, partial [Thermoleophilaceae bacterium]|nr:hypothetical protein [Thermoleophilaceae bacterium]